MYPPSNNSGGGSGGSSSGGTDISDADYNSIKTQVDALKEAAIVEDYFFVNDLEIELPAKVVMTAGEFCVDADQVVEIVVQVSSVSNPSNGNNFLLGLLGNKVGLAFSQSDDISDPSSTSLIYKGRAEADTHFEIMITGYGDNDASV